MLDTIITSAISLILGMGSTFLFFPQTRKEKNLQNESKQSEEWRKLYEESNEERKEERRRLEEHIISRDQRIDFLLDEITKHRDEKAEKSNTIAKLEVEVTRLKMLKCEVPACINRKPPTGF